MVIVKITDVVYSSYNSNILEAKLHFEDGTIEDFILNIEEYNKLMQEAQERKQLELF